MQHSLSGAQRQYRSLSLLLAASALYAGVASAQQPTPAQAAPLQNRAVILDNKSNTSLANAYSGVCSNGGMLVITPDFKSSEPLPANCASGAAVLDLRRPDSLTGRLNVRNEGAVGDGRADDTEAIQKAIDYAVAHPVGSGGQSSPMVYLPAGNYKISKSLRVPGQLHLLGDGPETTTLLLTSPTSNLITVYSGKCNDLSCNGSIEGMTLSGQGHLTTGTLLELSWADSFHIRDIKMYNHGGRGLQLNYGSERFNSNNLYIYAVRWPIILAGDINESYFWNTQIIGPGQTAEMAGNDKYCYSVNCIDGRYPGPNAGSGGSPTSITPDTHAAIFVDKAVNYSFIGGSIKPLKFLAGMQVFNGNVGSVKNFYFEGYPYDQAGRYNAAVIAGGAAEHTTLTSTLSGTGTVASVASTTWMPHFYNDPADMPLKQGADYYPYVLLPQDYLSGSTEPSRFVKGVARGAIEEVNVLGFGGDGKVYLSGRKLAGKVPANTEWPAGTIIEEMPLGFYGSLTLEDSHVVSIHGPGKGYKDNCDQTGVRTCAEIIVGNIPDGLYVDPNGGPNSLSPYSASINLRAVIIPFGSYSHQGEIATHRYANISLEGITRLPSIPADGGVVDYKNMKLPTSEMGFGHYVTAPYYSNGHFAEPQVTFPDIGGIYQPRSGLFARYESQFGQGGFPNGWMKGLKFANQYCWFDTPPTGQKQSLNRICMNGAPSNSDHAGFEYDVWNGSKWANAFNMQGHPDGSADVSVSGNLTVAKTLFVKSIQVASGAQPAIAAASVPKAALAGVTGVIGGRSLSQGECATSSAKVSGVTSSMVATVSPSSDPGDGFIWEAFATTNAIQVKVCALVKGIPHPVTYNVRAQ